MIHLDLFSGIGGFALAADWIWPGITHVFCEIEPFPQKVLRKHWPDAEIYGDIKKLDGKTITEKYGAVDILTGGFPCQPFSLAGKRGGKDDDRYLWPEMFRVIKETRPRWVIAENVPGIIDLALDQVCDDLESEGYETGTVVIPACAMEAWHIRSRVWIIANNKSRVNGKYNAGTGKRQIQQSGICDCAAILANAVESNCGQGDGKIAAGRHADCAGKNQGLYFLANTEDGENQFGECGKMVEKKLGWESCHAAVGFGGEDVSDADKQGLSESTQSVFAGVYEQNEESAWGESGRIAATPGQYWAVEPNMGRVANGVPNRVDRLRGLGNAIVPQVAAALMGFIKEIDGNE